MAIKKDKNTKNLGVWDSQERDKIKKETKSRLGERRVLEIWSRVKGLANLKVHPVLALSLRLPRGQAPKGIKIFKISRKRDLDKNHLVLNVVRSIG